MCRSTNRQAEPEVYFRIVHATQNGHNSAPVAVYREQTVEIALGPKGAFENGNIGILTRQVPTSQLVRAISSPRGKPPKPPREPKTPRVVVHLRQAMVWQALLDSGKIATQADIARREGITRARVTQIMGMLRLAPKIQEHILNLPETIESLPITERMLRPIVAITDYHDQIKDFQLFIKT